MWPTLDDGDRLLVSRLTYRVIPPKRGDIVLLRDPSRPGYECIKRIVALPGERIPAQTPGADPAACGQTLSDDEYFLLGDNLAHSHDSRAFGPVRRQALVGPTWYRYASRSRARGLL